jgi:hypothetical protein
MYAFCYVRRLVDNVWLVDIGNNDDSASSISSAHHPLAARPVK